MAAFFDWGQVLGKIWHVVDLCRLLLLQHAVFLSGEEIKLRQPWWRGASPIDGKISAAWMKILDLDMLPGLWGQSCQGKVEG